ncbi:NAD(P)-binding protein [Hymenopellis radicata]|nr:NAD(P)-binding protein [Hymenopellis radicata]
MASYKRVVLVTGSNTGIGFEIVKSLAEKGHTVYLSARNETAGKEAQSKLTADGLDVKFVQLDVTSPESVNAAKDVIEKAEGRLDSLVNNAGVGVMEKSAGALKEPLSNIQDGLNTNLLGLISVCQAFVPLLRRSSPGYACIVTVTSDMASNGLMASRPNSFLHSVIAYNTSKAAANSYTIALAKELEGEIKVNLVTPGFTTSKLNAFKEGGKTTKEGAEVIVPWALLGPEDKAKTCLFWGDDGPFPW